MSASARERPSWWLGLAAAAFTGYFLLLLSTDLRRPESAGFTYTIDAEGMRIANITRGSPADGAGLAPGDRVLDAQGRPIRSRLDWQAIESNLTLTEPIVFDVARGGNPMRVSLVLQRASTSFWLTTAGLTVATARLTQFATLILALVVAFRRPHDRVARVGAWLLATVAVFSFAWPYGFAARWRALPRPLDLALWLPYASSLVVAPIFLAFFTSFPRQLIRSPLARLALWIPAVPVLVLQLRYARWMIYEPGQPALWNDWTGLVVATTVAYALAAAAAIVIGYRRESDPGQRRRVRVLACGSFVGMLGVLPLVIDYWSKDAVLGSSVFGSPLAVIGALVGLTLPASFAYAILRYRVFNVSVIVRRSLQYALARQVLVSMVPLATAAFIVDIVGHRQEAVGDILQARGWVYGGLAAFAIVAHTQRRRWLDALDRRFFRERYNAQRLLRSIGDEIRRAPELPAFAPLIVTRIEEALHPERSALLVRQPGDRDYRVAAIAPPAESLSPLPAHGTIAGLLPLLRRPLTTPMHHNSIVRQLPSDELEWLRHHRIDLLVPVRFGAGAVEAFFALGPRRSEEPYSGEDEDLLMTIGHGVALLLSHPAAAEVERGVPAVLADRYRLDGRIGQGGMGTVYAADDLALGRRVAVKVLREDLPDPSAIERFRMEAHIAAAFSHPNVVTVYDIGVTPSGRPFFVMELLSGVTLAQALTADRRLAPPRAVGLLKGIGAAVKAAHARQLIHRDLKPENIFLQQSDDREIARVLDFGLAKALDATRSTRLTQPGLVAGTPRYMAPEHLAGSEPSPDWDLWSLAAIALEMLAGEEALGAPPAGPRFDALSAPLRRVFSSALSRDPLDRPTGVDEFLDALERALADHEVSA